MIHDLLDSTQKRLVGNRFKICLLFSISALAAMFCSYPLALFFGWQNFYYILAALSGLLWLFVIIKQLTNWPTRERVIQSLDQKLATKDRIVSFESIPNQANDARADLIQKQLEKEVSQTALAEITAFGLPRTQKFILAFFLGITLIAIIVYFTEVRGQSAVPEVRKLEQLIKELEDKLPDEARLALEQLADSINETGLTSEQSRSDLAYAKSIIQQAKQNSSNASTTDQLESSETAPENQVPLAQESPSPSPSASPEPEQQQEQQDQNTEQDQKENSDQSEKSEQQDDSGSEGQKSDQGQAKEGDQGQGEGSEAAEGAGESESKSDQSEGQVAGQGSSQEEQTSEDQKSGEQSSESQGSDSQGSEGQPGESDGSEDKSQSETGEQQEQKTDQEGQSGDQGESKGGEKGEKDQQNEKGGSGQDQALEQAEQALDDLAQAQAGKSGGKSGKEKSEQQSEESQGGAEQDSKASEKDQETGDGGEGEEEGEQPSKPGQSENSPPDLQQQDQTSDGDKGAGLAGENIDNPQLLDEQSADGQKALDQAEGFEDLTISEQPENFDQKFLGEDTTIKEGEGGSAYKTTLEEVELAKPEVDRSGQRQEIPLEYRDVLR